MNDISKSFVWRKVFLLDKVVLDTIVYVVRNISDSKVTGVAFREANQKRAFLKGGKGTVTVLFVNKAIIQYF